MVEQVSERAVVDRTVDTGTDTVSVVVRDRVGIITLTRPDRRNALHHEMYPAMVAALDAFAVADDVGVVVLTGEGKGFCAGGDVRDGRPRRADGTKPTFDERVASLGMDETVVLRLHEHPKVTIAAVNGAAVGAGMSLALACDMRVADASTKFIGGWVKLALTGDFGGAWFLTRLVGAAKAIEILVTNQAITADEALRLGMVNRVLPSAEFADGWFAFARSIGHGPQGTIAAMKRNVIDAMTLPLGDALAAEARRIVHSSTTADHKTAVRAWLAGTDPIFAEGTGGSEPAGEPSI